MSQHFVSYAHDNQNGSTYRGRVVFPAHAVLPTAEGAGSRIVYNLFDGQSWTAVITNPGGVDTATTLADTIVWDVIDRGADDADVIASPVDTSRPVMVPSYVNDNGDAQSWVPVSYYPRARTDIYRWKRAAGLASLKSIEGSVPYLGVAFSSPGTSATSEAAHFQTVRSLDRATKSHVVLVTVDPTGTVGEAAYDW